MQRRLWLRRVAIDRRGLRDSTTTDSNHKLRIDKTKVLLLEKIAFTCKKNLLFFAFLKNQPNNWNPNLSYWKIWKVFLLDTNWCHRVNTYNGDSR